MGDCFILLTYLLLLILKTWYNTIKTTNRSDYMNLFLIASFSWSSGIESLSTFWHNIFCMNISNKLDFLKTWFDFDCFLIVIIFPHSYSYSTMPSLRSSSRSSMGHIKPRISKRSARMLEICLGEILGTAMLMFFGCMSLVQGFSQNPLPTMQPGLMFGFVVSTVIVIFGHISGAHLNPTVTISAFLLEMVPFVEVLVYVVSQILGALIGVGLLNVITPQEILYPPGGPVGFCATVPHASLTTLQAFLAEFFSTSLLIFTCCGVWDRRTARFGDAVPVKFALVIALCSITVGPYTGASMNPARSLAPAVFSQEWSSHWIYWVSPLLSSVVTTLIYKYVFAQESGGDEKSHPEQLSPADIEGSVPINWMYLSFLYSYVLPVCVKVIVWDLKYLQLKRGLPS